VSREPVYRDKLDMSQVFLRQLDRVNQSAGTPMYPSAVTELARNLPVSSLGYVKANSERYTEQKPVFKFNSPTGFRIGSVDHPTLRDPRIPVRRLEGEVDWTDPNIRARRNVGTKDKPVWEPFLQDDTIPVKRLEGPIDWGDPNILSPRLVFETSTNYEVMCEVIKEAAELAGLSWEEDLVEEDAGDTEEEIERKKTPLFWTIPAQGVTEEDEDDDEVPDAEGQG